MFVLDLEFKFWFFGIYTVKLFVYCSMSRILKILLLWYRDFILVLVLVGKDKHLIGIQRKELR